MLKVIASEPTRAPRTKRVHVSNLGPIAGLVPSRGPFEVWESKFKGINISPELQELFDVGHAYEDPIAELWRKKYDPEVYLETPPVVLDSSRPWLAGSADRLKFGIQDEARSLFHQMINLRTYENALDEKSLKGDERKEVYELKRKTCRSLVRVIKKATGGVEIKTAPFSRDFGDEGSDILPPGHLAQAAGYCILYDFESWDFGVSIAGQYPRNYTYHRDEKFEAILLERAEKFYQECIVTGEPPKVDGSDAANRYVRELYPENSVEILEASEEQEVLLAKWRAAKDHLDQAKKQEAGFKQELQLAIGDASGLTSPSGRITWHKAKDSLKTDYKAALKAMADRNPALEQYLEELLAEFTTAKPGSRRFLFKG